MREQTNTKCFNVPLQITRMCMYVWIVTAGSTVNVTRCRFHFTPMLLWNPFLSENQISPSVLVTLCSLLCQGPADLTDMLQNRFFKPERNKSQTSEKQNKQHKKPKGSPKGRQLWIKRKELGSRLYFHKGNSKHKPPNSAVTTYCLGML